MQEIMDVTDIAFPNLGIYLHNVPQSFNIFGLRIALYGVLIALGTLCGLLVATAVAKKRGYNTDILWDVVLYGIIFGIIGARTYYVIFQWDYYKNNLLAIFNLRQGGIAIYGCVIGAFLTAYIYARVKKISFFELIDYVSFGFIVGQIIGRWGNFFNREVFGDYTDNILAMRLPVAAIRDMSDISVNISAHMSETTNYIQVHPTFLYEGLWNAVVFVLMLLLVKKVKYNGQITLLYLGGYGLGRAWIEGVRTDRLTIAHTNIAVSQVLGAVLFVGAIVAHIIIVAKGVPEKLAVDAKAGDDSTGTKSEESESLEEVKVEEVENLEE